MFVVPEPVSDSVFRRMPTTLNELMRPDFGAWLAAARERRGLTLVALADKAGISKASISQYEAGNRFPTRPSVIAIAQALDVAADEALEAAGFVAEGAGGDCDEANEFRREVLGYYQGKPLEGIVPSNVTPEQLSRIRLAVRLALQRDDGIILDPLSIESNDPS